VVPLHGTKRSVLVPVFGFFSAMSYDETDASLLACSAPEV
jgi:hypothetical protein